MGFHLHYITLWILTQVKALKRKESDIIMPIYKSKKPTKSGKVFFFKVSYIDSFGNKKQKSSKLYEKKSEARDAELKFLSQLKENRNAPMDMTFEDLYYKFREFQDDKIRDSTKRNYVNKLKYLTPFMKIKCKDYTIDHYEDWKKELNKNPNLVPSTKNDILKFWKSILNYGAEWYGFDFSRAYRKMTKFNNPDELKKEMSFYTFEEFQKFLSYEDDLYYRCVWKILYYCGLRRGEARGLQWTDIDFKNKTLSVNKQVQSIGDHNTQWYISKPKTDSSYRVIPMCDSLVDELKLYYEKVSKFENFNKNFFVLGRNNGVEPFPPSAIRDRKRKLSQLAGLKEIRLHDFRHSCASLLINNGANITLVARFLGHSKIEETLSTYTHMFQSAMDQVVNLINDISAN